MLAEILTNMDWSPIIETVTGFVILALTIGSPIALIVKHILNKFNRY